MLTTHKILTQRMDEKVQIFLDGEMVAETSNALQLFEPGHAPVIYVPKNDLHEIDLEKFDDYHCPLKGHADLLTVRHGEKKFANIAWSYVDPFEELNELKGRIAFYPDKVDEIRVID